MHDLKPNTDTESAFNEECIFALATPQGRSAVAVIRLSGPGVVEKIQNLWSKEIPKHQHASVGQLCDEDGMVLDQVLLLFFKGPNSYTGEDVVEIHPHGNPLIVSQIIACLRRVGFRQAEAGEFTKRAYLNGKMDLAQAESVSDIINAQTMLGLRGVQKQFSGRFSSVVMHLRERLVNALAWIEADIDFGDREVDDVVPASPVELEKTLDQSLTELNDLLENVRQSRWLREGYQVVLIGRPNVGKSSLFNRFLGQTRALVNEAPGTTRDYLEARIDLNGIPCRFVDTAGLRQTQDALEKEGIQKSIECLKSADLILAMFDTSEPLNSGDHDLFSVLKSLASELKETPVIVFLNKSDLGVQAVREEDIRKAFPFSSNQLRVFFHGSATSGDGFKDLVQAIERQFAERNEDVSELGYLSERQADLLMKTRMHIEKARQASSGELGLACTTYDLRLAINTLSRVLGRALAAHDQLEEMDEVLDEVFSSFCIGK